MIAIQNAFTGVGTVLTMAVLLAGFISVLTSDAREDFALALIAIKTLSAVLFADLVFLPAQLAY